MEKQINLQYFQELSGGDPVFIKEMLELFLSTTSLEVENFSSLIASSNFDAIASLAHKMKAPIQMMGATKLFDLVKSIESGAKSRKSIEELSQMISEMHSMLENLSIEIKESIAAL